MELLDIQQVRKLDDALTAAHLEDWLSKCGCSKQSLRVCVKCATVTCDHMACPCNSSIIKGSFDVVNGRATRDIAEGETIEMSIHEAQRIMGIGPAICCKK